MPMATFVAGADLARCAESHHGLMVRPDLLVGTCGSRTPTVSSTTTAGAERESRGPGVAPPRQRTWLVAISANI